MTCGGRAHASFTFFIDHSMFWDIARRLGMVVVNFPTHTSNCVELIELYQKRSSGKAKTIPSCPCSHSHHAWGTIPHNIFTYPGVLAKIFCLNVGTYKVGTYIISDWVKRQSWDKKTHRHKGCGWLAPRRGSKYYKTHRQKGCGWLASRRCSNYEKKHIIAKDVVGLLVG